MKVQKSLNHVFPSKEPQIFPSEMDVKLNAELFSQMKTVFDLCDKDGVGFITVSSFLDLGRHYLSSHGQDLTNLLLQMDPSGTGIIAFEDFQRGILSATVKEFQYHHIQPTKCVTCNNFITSLPYPKLPSQVMDNGCTCHEYDLDDEDQYGNNNNNNHLTHSRLCSHHDRLSRHSPESFGDTDSAIVVVPPTSESGSGSPDFSRKIISVSDGEERYECYGEGECEDYEINPSSSSTPTASARNHGGGNRNSKTGGQPFQKRTTWLRTSLRKSPSERRRITSNSLASQLYRSSSFNSSSHNSNCSSGDSDDMHPDLSLEEDVLDLNERVHMLQQQVTALASSNNSNDADKYYRVKQENAALTTRIMMLDEQFRELEIRSESRLKEEQQRYKELLNKHERERGIELDSCNLKLQSAEQQNIEFKEEMFRLRAHVERLKQEKNIYQDQAINNESMAVSLKEELQKLQELSKREREEISQERARNTRFLEELTKEMGELRRFKVESENYQRHNSFLEPPSRLRELEEQIRVLKDENKCYQETAEELQAQILSSSIAEGRSLLHYGDGTSLAAEFETMSKDEMMESLREQREVNAKLRAYIDGILLNIMDCYPALLEVKNNGLAAK